jgi:hypothetical protein
MIFDKFIELHTNIEGNKVAKFKYDIPILDCYGNLVSYFDICEDDLKTRLANRRRDKQNVMQELIALEAFERYRNEYDNGR